MKKLMNAATLGLAAWTVLFASISFSEPYKVAKGDTLSGIAAAHNVTVEQIKTANRNITNLNILRVGQVIVIPEPPSSIAQPASPSDNQGGSPPAPHTAAGNAARETAEVTALRTGLDQGWMVSQDQDSGKIFVHTGMSDDKATGLRYLIKERSNLDGTASWTVYSLGPYAEGLPTYGRSVGVLDKPQSVVVTVRKDSIESPQIAAIRKGLAGGWVVTQNGSGKIFVHESESGGMLVGLRYLIKETDNPDGTTSWTVYNPVEGDDGSHSYGRVVGKMEKPSDVGVGGCTCE